MAMTIVFSTGGHGQRLATTCIVVTRDEIVCIIW